MPTRTDKRHGVVVRVERMTSAELRLHLEHLRFVQEATEAGQQYAQRLNAAGQRLREAVNGVCVGHLQASADRAAFDAAFEEARSWGVSLLNVVPRAGVDQKHFDAIAAEIERRLVAQGERSVLQPSEPEEGQHDA